LPAIGQLQAGAAAIAQQLRDILAETGFKADAILAATVAPGEDQRLLLTGAAHGNTTVEVERPGIARPRRRQTSTGGKEECAGDGDGVLQG
jgi:hypothetical protein